MDTCARPNTTPACDYETAAERVNRIETYVKLFNLKPHPYDNGFFARTLQGRCKVKVTNELADKRDAYNAYTVIYYLLAANGQEPDGMPPFIPFHSNKSDIVHFYHDGWSVTYYYFHPERPQEVMKAVLGPDVLRGHQFHLKVPGGTFKAAVLNVDSEGRAAFEGEEPFCLISEQSVPGFEYRDHERLSVEAHLSRYPQVFERYGHLVHS